MKKAIAVFLALCALLLCACAVPSKDPSAKPSHDTSSSGSGNPLFQHSSSASSSPSTKPSSSPSVKPSASASASAKPSSSASASASAKPSPSASASASASVKPSPSASVKPSAAASSPVALDKTELAYFSDYFKAKQNYGFLLSSYTKPADIDVNALFYIGAGIASDYYGSSSNKIPQAEVDAYMKKHGIQEMDDDLLKLTTKQIDDFLKEKMGVTLAQLSQKLKWTYLDQYDAYYTARSDTNIETLAAVSGTKTSDGTYVIQCTNVSGYGEVDTCQVTMKKSGDHYLFVSNQAHKKY